MNNIGILFSLREGLYMKYRGRPKVNCSEYDLIFTWDEDLCLILWELWPLLSIKLMTLRIMLQYRHVNSPQSDFFRIKASSD